MGYILAYTLNYNNHDGRYSHSNKEWADTTCKGERGSNIRTDWIVRSHPAVLNGFVDMYRKELAAEQQREPEKPFVQQFYVVTDLQTNPMKIEKFGNLDDAMSCYQQVPNKDSLVVVAGFIRSSSSGILVTLDTKNLFIDGCAGTWVATEECVVESQHFFLMQHEVYKEKAPNVIVDASGKLVSTEIRKGLDEDARKKILDYLHPPLMEKPMNQKPSLHQMEHYQKFYENGEYVRAVESTTEQNYNMIDGCANNLPKPRIINGRESVLDKLRIRQMAREKQKSSQEQSADMERNRK